ncbi:MAG: hypothetical protein AAGG59_02595 [Bacteroidota bacterium]
MKRKLGNIASIAIGILLLPLILVAVVFAIPFALLQDARSKRRLRRWLNQNDYSYFFIYSTGKRKKRFFEQEVIPRLNQGVEIGIFDGIDFKGFITTEIARLLSIYDNEGFPIIGKIENGELFHKSLKKEYHLWVVQDKNENKFINEVLDGLDDI